MLCKTCCVLKKNVPLLSDIRLNSSISLIYTLIYMKHRLLLLLAAVMCCSFSLLAADDKEPQTYNYKRAMEAFEEQDYDTALEYFQREVSDNPKSGRAHFFISAINVGVKENMGAGLTSLNSAIKSLDGDNVYLASSYKYRSDIYMAMGDTVAALADLDNAIAIQPYDSDYRFAKAHVYFLQGDYENSNKVYKELLEVNEGNVGAYVGLGRNYTKQGNYAEAVKMLDYAEKLNEDYGMVYAVRATAHFGLKDWRKAASDVITEYDLETKAPTDVLKDCDPVFLRVLENKVNVVIAGAPNQPKWPVLLAAVYADNEKWGKAIKYYTQALDIAPSPTIYYNLGKCYGQAGNHDKALENLDKALEADSTDQELLFQRSETLYNMGRVDEALGILDGVLEDQPDNLEGYMRRAEMHRHTGKLEQSIEDYTTVLTFLPELTSAIMGRGRCYDLLGKKEMARKDFLEVVRLDSVPADAQDAMQAHLFLGNTDKAIELNDSCLAAHPNSGGTVYNSACLYSLMGNTDKALDELQRAFDLGFAHLSHMASDVDLDNVRNLPRYKQMVAQRKAQIAAADDNTVVAAGDGQTVISEIPFTRENGITKVQCTINGLPLSFYFDTGASDVTLSLAEARYMLKNGYLTRKDIGAQNSFSDANGDVSVGTVINLRKVKFGDCELENVKASVVGNQRAPLLLGQTVLSRLGKIEIDYSRNMIIIKK